MARLILLLGLVLGLVFFMRWLSRQPTRVIWQWVAILLAVVMLIMVLTGRAHWLAAVIAALLPFLRGLFTLLGNLPLLKRILAGAQAAKAKAAPRGGQTSSVQSRYIRMVLDHDSGDIDGEVLAGRYQGRRLGEMELDGLLQLLQECADDEESVALLQTYLDRVYADTWRQQAGTGGQRQAASGPNEMTREEALQVLGLSSGASDGEITEAHRRLMQKLHPDRGGSAYLAATINLAKETLLGR